MPFAGIVWSNCTVSSTSTNIKYKDQGDRGCMTEGSAGAFQLLPTWCMKCNFGKQASHFVR